MASHNKFCDEITHDCLKDFEYIGHGAFGTIYRARHKKLGVDVAVKFLNSNTTCTREELLNEARAMDKARFKYIVHLYGLYVDKVPEATKAGSLGDAVPRLGLVMEFMENGSLASLQSRVPSVPWALQFHVLHEVALGMNFLHGLKPPLLHLDLKPSNVLLDKELCVRVADFGLSKFKRGSSQHSLCHKEGDEYGGTLEYMPPEAFTVNYKPTTGTDIYSYGILMWTLLTGKEPYENIHPSNVSFLVKMLIPQGQRPCTEELEKKIPEVCRLQEMIKLMKRCWHNEETQRPSFLDCSQETEDVCSYYKQEIVGAVREVQDILRRKDSSPAIEKSTSSLTPSRASPSSSRSKCSQSHSANSPPGLVEHFKTFQVYESSPHQTEAVPIKNCPPLKPELKPSLHHIQRSSSVCFGKDTSEPHSRIHPHPEANVQSHTRPREKKPPRPRSDIYPFATFPPYHPEFLYTQQPETTPGCFNLLGFVLPEEKETTDQGDPLSRSRRPTEAAVAFFRPFCGPDPGSTPGHSSFLQTFNPRSSQGGGICIYGQSIQGIQVGDGNFIHIEQAPQKE